MAAVEIGCGEKRFDGARALSSIDGPPEMIEHANDPSPKTLEDDSKLEINAPGEERVTPKAWACVFVRFPVRGGIRS